MITGYERGPVKLTDDDHCGRGRRTVTLTVGDDADDTAIRKLNRELTEYGFELVGALTSWVSDEEAREG